MNYFMQHKGAFIGTTIFVALLLLFLLFCGLTIPEDDDKIIEKCILLDFTTPSEESTLLDTRGGGGNPNAGASTANATTSNQNTSTQNSNSNSNSNPSVESQAFEDAAHLPSGNESTSETTENTEPKQTSRAEGLNFGGLAGGSGSGNSGNGAGGGNPGFGGGSGSNGGSGTGPGGIGSIGNRKVTKVMPENKDNMTGTVKLSIWVDENGNVIKAEQAAGTTCSECVPFAIKAVKQWKYEAKPGSGTQTGIVTVEFKLK